MSALAFLRRHWRAVAVLVTVLALWGGMAWHAARVAHAYTIAFNAGAAKQAAADRADFVRAETAATAKQAGIIAASKATATTISKGTDNGLQKRYTALAGDYDALRLRWAAHRADQGRAGNDGATGIPTAASIPDDAYCKAQGWVDFNAAAAAAQAADEAIAKDDAWRAWWTAQAEAWPR